MIAELELARIATDIERTWAAWDERSAAYLKAFALEDSLQAMQEATRLIQEEKRVRAEIEVDFELVVHVHSSTWNRLGPGASRLSASLVRSWIGVLRDCDRPVFRTPIEIARSAVHRIRRAPGDDVTVRTPPGGWQVINIPTEWQTIYVSDDDGGP